MTQCSNRTIVLLSLILLLPFSKQNNFLSGYGERCNNYTECKDHRMICTGQENNKTCTCVKYHEWKDVDQSCVQMFDAERIMRLELVYNNITEEIAREQDRVFILQLWAGGFVVAFYIVAILVIMLFCLYVRSADTAMHREMYALKLKIRRDTLMRRNTIQV